MDPGDVPIVLQYFIAINGIAEVIIHQIRERRRRVAAIIAWIRRMQRRRVPQVRYCVMHLERRGVLWVIFRGEVTQTRRHLRVTPNAFNLLVAKIANKRHGWKPQFEAIFFLFWLACGTSYRVVSATFNVPRTTVFRAVKRMLQVIVGLMPEVIALPAEGELEGIGEEFAVKAGSRAFRRCVGAIDGTHIRVFCPRGKSEDYINRKLSYSLQMQAVCIASGKIIHAFTGFPGSVHDSRVLRHSSIYSEGRYPPEGYFLVGDGGYPCRAAPIALITPYRVPSNESQALFNHRLSKARIVVERVFGMMKTRWRSIFTKVIEVKIAKAVKVIIACAVMHNVCLTAGDVLHIQENVQPVRIPQNEGVDGEEPGEDIRGAMLELMEIEEML